VNNDFVRRRDGVWEDDAAPAVARARPKPLEHSGENFTNILRAPFSHKSASHLNSLVTFWLWQKYESTFIQKTGV